MVVFIIKMMRSIEVREVGHVERMREIINPYRILVGNPEGKRPLQIIRLGL
jgi:hypothetical protein